jgi:hypothetical protein
MRKSAGIPKDVWKRDMRAAAVTEAREAGVATADVAKVIGDTERTTAQVYDRGRLAAARRTAKARNACRDRDGNEG